jgi:hypothetical protein
MKSDNRSELRVVIGATTMLFLALLLVVAVVQGFR